VGSSSWTSATASARCDCAPASALRRVRKVLKGPGHSSNAAGFEGHRRQVRDRPVDELITPQPLLPTGPSRRTSHSTSGSSGPLATTGRDLRAPRRCSPRVDTGAGDQASRHARSSLLGERHRRRRSRPPRHHRTHLHVMTASAGRIQVWRTPPRRVTGRGSCVARPTHPRNVFGKTPAARSRSAGCVDHQPPFVFSRRCLPAGRTFTDRM
jgi:hypothetical protein